MHGCQHSDNVLRPRPSCDRPGSTLIQRQTPKRGQGPQQQAGLKQVSAWRHPPFSVCAVPTHGPEGSRAELPVSCFAAQLNTGSVSRLPCLSTGTGLARRGGNGYCKREPRFLLLTQKPGLARRSERPVHGCQNGFTFSDLGPSPGPGSTLIQRQTPKRGQGPQQQAGLKQVSAWRHPPFSVCAVPTHGPEGGRAEQPLFRRSAQYRFRLPPPPPFNRGGTCQTGREWLL